MRRHHEITPVNNHQTGFKQLQVTRKEPGTAEQQFNRGTPIAQKRNVGTVKKLQLYRAATSEGKYK